MIEERNILRRLLTVIVATSLICALMVQPVGAQSGSSEPVISPSSEPTNDLGADDPEDGDLDPMEDPPEPQRHPTLICGTHAYFTGPFIISGNCLSPFDTPPLNDTYGGLVGAVCRAIDTVLDDSEDHLDRYVESETQKYNVYRKAVQRVWKVYKKLPKKYRRMVRRGVSYGSIACFIATP